MFQAQFKFAFLSITMFNSQLYHYFVIFPKEIYYKNLVLNHIKLNYNEVLTQIDFILADKSPKNDLISLDFLDSILSIDRQRMHFLATTIETIDQNKSIFFNLKDLNHFISLNNELQFTMSELSYLINSISVIV